LHAWKLAFVHPAHGGPLEFLRPPPEDLARAWQAVAPGLSPGDLLET
jgi:hypothetical protein